MSWAKEGIEVDSSSPALPLSRSPATVYGQVIEVLAQQKPLPYHNGLV
jgi:hypothetical protein